MSMNEMESKIRELRQLQALIDEAQQEAEAIKDQIKASMIAQGAEELRAGEYRITWKAVTASRLDTAAKLDRMVWRLCDLKAQYFYRMGLQDGVSMTGSDFLTRGLS